MESDFIGRLSEMILSRLCELVDAELAQRQWQNNAWELSNDEIEILAAQIVAKTDGVNASATEDDDFPIELIEI